MRARGAVVTGLLEPAYEVAGDAFDYAHNGDRLDIAVLDGMGHGISSTLLTTLAVGAYRHARRNGEAVDTMHRAIDDAVERQYDGDAFVTGILARLDLHTGALTWSNAGHPAPLLLRNRKVVGPMSYEPSPPFGLDGTGSNTQVTALEPGDSVLMYTDGMVEARTSTGSEFGLERLVDLLERAAAAQVSPEETLRRLIRDVLEHHGGELRDDATLVLLQWTGPADAGLVPQQDPGPR
jgi:serine phosphatase RsbU (regulator of sigma subunit)